MEHSIYFSLMLILMLFALAVLVILIFVLNKIREELNSIKKNLSIMRKRDEEPKKQHLQFNAKLHINPKGKNGNDGGVKMFAANKPPTPDGGVQTDDSDTTIDINGSVDFTTNKVNDPTDPKPVIK